MERATKRARTTHDETIVRIPTSAPVAAGNLSMRLEATIAMSIESAKLMRERKKEHCAVKEINDFYLEWDRMVNSEEVILAETPDSLQIKPMDEFCPFCHLEDIEIEFNGIIGPLSKIMKDVLENALTVGKSLDEAVIDTWMTFNMDIGRRMHSVAPSLGSINAGGRIDMPTCTVRTMVEHFTLHAINGSDVLFRYLLEDADKHDAMRTIQMVYTGARKRADLDQIVRSRQQQAEAARGPIMVKKRKN